MMGGDGRCRRCVNGGMAVMAAMTTLPGGLAESDSVLRLRPVVVVAGGIASVFHWSLLAFRSRRTRRGGSLDKELLRISSSLHCGLGIW